MVPLNELELTSGGMEAFRYLFEELNMAWAVPLIAAVITIGALGMLSTWIVGPSRGLLATAQDGDFPPLLQKTNKHGMPVAIFVLQGAIVTLLSFVFLYMPSVSASYWILMALASELYMIMYVLLFIAAIRLRIKQPGVERTYRVPGGKIGMWIVCCIGLAGALFAMVISFLPPSQLETGSLFLYESIFFGGTALFCLAPVAIYHLRKPEWKKIE